MNKVTLNLNASSLPYTNCIKRWYLTTVSGYRERQFGAALVYGLSIHKFVDLMYKTRGHTPTAREAMLRVFRQPKWDNKKSIHLSDERHLTITAYNLWEFYVQQDSTYDLLMINQKCWACNGSGVDDVDQEVGKSPVVTPCSKCEGTGNIVAPATEVDFSFKYYEDEFIIVNMCGTIDKVGKIRNGCGAVGDWKNTSDHNPDAYLEAYERSAQLRFYLLALKVMARLHPETILGQLGSQQCGAFIDGIFLRPKPMDNIYKRSEVYQYKGLDIFESMLQDKIQKFSNAIRDGKQLQQEGLVNGACRGGKYACPYVNVCANDGPVEKLLLTRDFIQTPYDPLRFHDAI